MAVEPEQEQDSHVSRPIKRLRWATQRVTGQSGRRKRHSIMDRLHKRTTSNEKKRESGGTVSLDGSHPAETLEGSEASEAGHGLDLKERKIYFNTPLPDDAKDVDGHPIMNFTRNKIRTAKYTPVSFVPKNLWWQFHNIANIYFLFITILAVSPTQCSEFLP